jgi:hypothetical protein
MPITIKTSKTRRILKIFGELFFIMADAPNAALGTGGFAGMAGGGVDGAGIGLADGA